MKNPLLSALKKISYHSSTSTKEDGEKKRKFKLEVKIETDGNLWYVQVDGGPFMEFKDRVYALIYLNNVTVSMTAEEE